MAGGKVNASPLGNQALPLRRAIPQRGLCKSREPGSLALQVPLMVREQMNSTLKASCEESHHTGASKPEVCGTSDSPGELVSAF